MLDFKSEFKSFKKINSSQYNEKRNINVDFTSLQNAVNCYNEAIEAIKANNDDIASIQLRKALNYYKDFIEAKALLGLCMIKRREFKEAEELLNDIKNTYQYIFKANHYLNYLNSLNDNEKKGYYDYYESKSNKKTKNKLILVGLVFGLAVGMLLTYFYYTPKIESFKQKYNNENTEFDKEITQIENKYEQTQSELENANTTIENLNEKISDYKQKEEYYKKVLKIIKADQLYNSGKAIEALDILIELKDANFKNDELEKYKLLYSTASIDVASDLFYEAYNLYKRSEFSKALEKFSLSLKYNDSYDNAHRALYYAGKCCQFNGDYAGASMYYNRLINKYPNNVYAGYARGRLEEIN